MIDIKDVVAGESYACKFRIEHMLDADGNLSTADGSIFELGTYEGLGVIIARDADQQLVKLRDTKSKREFTVSFKDIWDIDTVDWV